MSKKKKTNNSQGYFFPGCPLGVSSSKRKRLVVEMLFDKQSGKCFYCKRKMKMVSKKQRKVCGLFATIDHIIPVSHGGESSIENVLLSCADCNFRRGGRWVNPMTGEGLSLPLDFGRRWDFLFKGVERAN